MDEEILIPSLRFSGNKDVWEQSKFSETFIYLQNNSLSRADLNYEQGSVKNIHYGDVLIKFGQILDVEKADIPFISNNEFDVNSTSLLQNGDVIIADAAEDETVGKCSEIKGIDGMSVVSGLHTIPCRPNKSFASGYLGYYLNSSAYHDQLLHLIQGTKISSISKSALQSTDILYPNTEQEQLQIGRFFQSLDNLITLHQNEYDKLLIMKKAMLRKMFPKNGNTVPEVRFSEFDGAWEYRKLGTISDKVTEKNVYMEYTETFTNSAEYGIISQREFFDHDIAKHDKINGYYIVRPEDFVYNPRISSTAPVGPIGRNKLGRCGVISPLYTVFRPKEVDNSFLEQFFKSSHWYSFMRFNGDTGARSDRFSIKDTTFFEMPIPFPKVEEQRRIGQYLTGLDVLISLQEKKLTKLKNIKSGCLEKMFVKSGR